MDSNGNDANVYGLVTELCRRFIDKNTPEEHPYIPRKDDTGTLKKLRSRAFEILLKKSPNKINHNDRQAGDPIAELLKHAFVLKTALGQCSRAQELESLTDSLEESQAYEDLGTYSSLQFLVGVKSYERIEEDSLNIFYYGRHNPALPEQLQNPKEVPRYQVYPMESLVLPERFERMLGIKRGDLMLGNSGDRRSNLSFRSPFRSAATIGIESLGSEDNAGSMFSMPRYTVKLASTREFSMSSFFVPNITEDSLKRISEYSTGHIGSLPRPEPPWLCLKSACDDVESNSEISDDQLTAVDLNEKAGGVEELLYAEWDNVDDMGEVSEHRTWEALGRLNAPKEPPFITEQNEAMLHLERISQAGYLFLLPRKIVDKIDFTIKEISTRDLLESIKLLLVGVESKNFTWDEKSRAFTLRNNVMVPGLSVEATRSACSDVLHWGACYRSLSLLVKPDPWTVKRQHQGLIFKAMCNSVKEFFVFYQAAVLRISLAQDESPALLKLLHHIKPMGEMMSEVARLCRCDSDDQSTLDDGLGLLSHIYDQVTRVTKPRVAMIFYSILKACCEVYFRMLERWIFDGNCDDAYGEFMIRQRPQFLHERNHRFWTKAHALNGNSVPGFLSHLTDSIIECGKTVRLLKVCDPKNPLCTMFATSRPTVRVCLSVGMVREQEIACSETLEKGERLLGKNVSFSYAFEEQRIAERNRARLVVAAQHETLERLKREIVEAKLETARNKRELLAQLKDQAGEVASRKEREREAELMKDRKYLEDLNAAEEIARNAEMAEKKSVLEYYNELAVEAERRRARADWRVRRMKLFEQRADSIIGVERELWGIEESERIVESEKIIEKSANVEVSKDEEIVEDLLRELPEAVESIESKLDESAGNEDENKNPTESEGSPEGEKAEAPDLAPAPGDVDVGEETKILPKKSPRPCVLEINRTTTTTANLNLNERRQTQDNGNTDDTSRVAKFDAAENRTAAQRNKLKIWQQEYGMTPNNNEFNIIVVDAEGNANTISIDPSTVDPDNLLSTAKIVTDRNENTDSRDTIDAWRCEVTGERIIERGDNLTEAQRNRNRNMAHYTETLNDFVPESTPDVAPLSEAQKNMRRNMSHTYRDDPPERVSSTKVNFAEYTELQRNRARVMGHDNRNYQDHGFEDVGANCLDPLTPMSQVALDDGMTPMSCTTDTFLPSISSSLTHEDLAKSAARSADTPGDLSSDEPTESRPTSSSFDFPRSTPAHPNFIGRDAAATPSFKSSLTIADVEMIDNTSLKVYLEKSVAIPLRVQSRLANAAIVKYLIYELNVLSHFHSLRRFFFLLDGEFARSLTSSLYKRLYDIAAPIELFRSATLTNLLKNALGSSMSGANDNSARLSLSAMSIPSQLQLSNPEFLNCLCLHYKISWPLNVLFDERLMEQYSKVFKFLVMVGRVLYVLQVDFNILNVERKASTSDQYHKLQLYRHSMMQFITAFHNYLTCSVLHASWAEFEKNLESAATLDQVYLTHVAYVKRILSRCMLTARSERIRAFLCDIFKVILKFHNSVRSQNWSTTDGGYTHAHFERLEEIYKAFCDARAYLVHVVEKLVSSGYQPHLTHFLNALNINPLYDLAHMNSSKKS